ncbi:glycosyl transferase family 1 domain protein [Acinetobacter baumannii 42057_3]|nr:glycosyl transferase family 1 domain protein [Acinetobacter baumannii 42057_3]
MITNKRNKRTPINKSTALFNAADININTKENINKIQIIPLLSKIKLFLFPVNENLVEIGNPELLAKKALQKLNSNLGLIEYSGIESFDWNEISKTWLSLYEGKDF